MTCLTFSPESGLVFSGSRDREAAGWFLHPRSKSRLYAGHAWSITSLAHAPDGVRVATGSQDRTARVWSGDSDVEVLKGHTGAVLAVAFSPDGRRILTGSADRTARIWDIAGLRPIAFKVPLNSLRVLTFSPDGRRLAAGGLDAARIWDAATGRLELSIPGRAWDLDFSPDGRRLVTAGQDGTARVWDAGSGRLIRDYTGQTGANLGVAFSPDGTRLAAVGRDSMARVWDADSGRLVCTFDGHRDATPAIAFSRDGRQIVTGAGDWAARVWDADSGREALTLRGHTKVVSAVAFSPDGTRIITASWDRSVRVWDAATGGPLLKLHSHGGIVGSIRFSPDGRRFLTNGTEGDVILSDTITGRNVLVLRPQGGTIDRAIAFAPDGRRIAIGSHDAVSIWQAATNQQIATWQTDERAAEESLAAATQERADAARDQGFLQDWLILAPIPLPMGLSGAEALDREQVPGEARLRPHPGDRIAVAGHSLAWKEHHSTDSFLEFNGLVGFRMVYGVAYAVCYLFSDAEQSGLRLGIGSDDQAKVYLNGQEVYACHKVRSLMGELDVVDGITLHQGTNVLVFKVVNQEMDWKWAVRLVGRDGSRVLGGGVHNGDGRRFAAGTSIEARKGSKPEKVPGTVEPGEDATAGTIGPAGLRRRSLP